MTAAADVLAFWFGPEKGAERALWFNGGDAFDAEIRARFAPLVEATLDGAHAGWAENADGALARILVLDQFPRNIWRGQARAFAGDPQALATARRVLARGFDAGRPRAERLFLYLPFEHSENMDDQERAVALVAALEHPVWTDYAERHRAVIARFGRFPHRNAALGRISTLEEIAFLQQPGSSF